MSVIDFRTGKPRPCDHEASTEIATPEHRESGRQRAGRQRNPLRRYAHRVSYAVTMAGKMKRGDPISGPLDLVACLHEGAEAAQYLAQALAAAAERAPTVQQGRDGVRP
jgi:hypothetical protein